MTQVTAGMKVRTCTSTGLPLIASPGHFTYRISQDRFGILNPPLRPLTGDRQAWGRWDVAGHRTLYVANSETSAYAEALSYVAPALPKQPMAELFDDITPSDLATLDEQIAFEMREHGSATGRAAPHGWRGDRTTNSLSLPRDGWVVDVSANQSLSAISRALGGVLLDYQVAELTLSVITNTLDKRVTTTIADWIRSCVLDDGSLPHGVVFRSKWGADWRSWAVWLRKIDEGFPSAAEPTKHLTSDRIGKPPKSLRDAANQKRIHLD